MSRSTRPLNVKTRIQDPERGIALILGMFLTIVAVGIIVSGTSLIKSFRTKTETAFVTTGQARQFARSGLTEALNWFRLHPSQPVLTFAPIRDQVADPMILQTDDPDIGLVRNFRINGLLWGRYEVWKQWDTDPDSSRLVWRQRMQATDVSARRNDPQPGSVWRIRAIGYVFRQVDPDKGFDAYPNQVLGMEVLETEIRRLSLTPPGTGALAVRAGNLANVTGNGQVVGGTKGAGVVYTQGTNAPGTNTLDRVTGTPAVAPIPDYNDNTIAVFGVTVDDLRAMADLAITKQGDFPSPIAEKAIVYSAIPSMTLSNSQPLAGFGVVYHLGNLTIEAGSNSNFSGLLYVDGNLVVNAPAVIKGTVVVTGTVTVDGIGDASTLMYDGVVLKTLEQTFGRYRFSSPFRSPNAAF